MPRSLTASREDGTVIEDIQGLLILFEMGSTYMRIWESIIEASKSTSPLLLELLRRLEVAIMPHYRQALSNYMFLYNRRDSCLVF